jgi:hypothetical protein
VFQLFIVDAAAIHAAYITIILFYPEGLALDRAASGAFHAVETTRRAVCAADSRERRVLFGQAIPSP